MLSIEYIAGFFDADGSVGLYKRGGSWQVNICIANSGIEGEKICKELQQRYKGAIVYCTKAKKVTHRDVFWWKINGTSLVKQFLLEIKDHLIIKKEQAILCLEFIDKWKNLIKRHKRTPEEHAEILVLSNKIKMLKHT